MNEMQAKMSKDFIKLASVGTIIFAASAGVMLYLNCRRIKLTNLQIKDLEGRMGGAKSAKANPNPFTENGVMSLPTSANTDPDDIRGDVIEDDVDGYGSEIA